MLSANPRTHLLGFIRASARLHKVLHVLDEVYHGLGCFSGLETESDRDGIRL